MKLLLSFIVFCTPLFAFSQQRQELIQLKFSGVNLSSKAQLLTTIDIKYGIETQQGFQLTGGLGMFTSRSNVNRSKFRGIILHGELAKRLIYGPSVISPLAALEFGSMVFHGKSECLFPETAANTGSFLNCSNTHIDRYGAFAKIKLLMDFKLQRINLRFGPNYTFQRIKGEHGNDARKPSKIISNYGLEASLIYRFQR